MREIDIRMRHFDESPSVVREELSDLGIEDIGGVGVSRLNLTLDVSVDNFFSDLVTQTRLKKAEEKPAAVGIVLTRLESRLGRTRDGDPRKDGRVTPAQPEALSSCCAAG